MVMDVRFLPNPHWDDELRPLTGHDPKVRDYVLETRPARLRRSLRRLLSSLLPQYEAEGRRYLTVAIGCTGGRHRSVAIAEELARRLRDRGVAVRAIHRDVSRLIDTPRRFETATVRSRSASVRRRWAVACDPPASTTPKEPPP